MSHPASDVAIPSALPEPPSALPEPSGGKPRQPSHRRKRVKTVAAILTGGVLAVYGGGAFLLSLPPAVFDSVPSKQAKQEKSARDAWQAAAALVSPSDRGLIIMGGNLPNNSYAKAVQQMAMRREVRRLEIALGSKKPPLMPLPSREPADVLARNAPALRAVRAALPLPYRVAPDSPTTSGRYRFHNATDFGVLGSLLLLDGNQKQKSGDNAGAAGAYLDIIQMGQTITRGGPAETHSEGGAFQKTGQTALWKLLGKMDAQTARQTAKRLELLCDEADAHASYADALIEEKARGETAIHELFKDPKRLHQIQTLYAAINQAQARLQAGQAQMRVQIRAQMQSQRSRASSASGGKSVVVAAPPRLSPFSSALPAPASATAPASPWEPLIQRWNEWKMVREFDRTLSPLIAASRLPFQTQQAALQQQSLNQSSVSVSSGNGSLSMTASGGAMGSSFPPLMYTAYGRPSSLRNALNQWTACQTENRLLLVALARQAYRADHEGRDPARLSDLVPAYLVRVPDDPYALPVAPLRFQNGILYSVGPDNKDDNGAPVQGFIRRGSGFSLGFYGLSFMQPLGKGDIVAEKTGP